MMIHHTSSEEETIAIATKFAATLPPRAIVLLDGTLGMGKSVFARALIRALVGNPELTVPSPTFTLVQTYDSPKGEIAHFDLYRLKAPEELYEIGWEDAQSNALCLIEWPERLGYLTPKTAIRIHIEGTENNNERKITIT